MKHSQTIHGTGIVTYIGVAHLWSKYVNMPVPWMVWECLELVGWGLLPWSSMASFCGGRGGPEEEAQAAPKRKPWRPGAVAAFLHKPVTGHHLW